MDQFIHFGVFHLSTSMEYWENLITTIEQLKSRLWENVSKVNNLVCHGHANMVMKLLIFCIHKWLELCYRMTHLICFMLNTVPCSQQKKTSLRKVYSSASVSIPPHNLKWSWQTCIVENGITNVDCFAMTCNRVTCQFWGTSLKKTSLRPFSTTSARHYKAVPSCQCCVKMQYI